MVYFTIINWESLFVCDLNIFYIPRTFNMLKKLSEASKVSTSELYLPDLSTRIFSTSFRPAVNICFIQINNKNMLKTIILPYSYFIFRKKVSVISRPDSAENTMCVDSFLLGHSG